MIEQTDGGYELKLLTNKHPMYGAAKQLISSFWRNKWWGKAVLCLNVD